MAFVYIYNYFIDNEMYERERKEKIIYQQILEYYNFHAQLNKYYISGYNDNAKKKREYFYFINSNWINIWKSFVNYEKAIKYISSYDNFIHNVGVNFESLHEFDSYCINSGESLDFFLSKTIMDINDFDCLISQKSYELFSEIFPIERYNFFCSKIEYIEGILFERILILVINNQKRIKVF